MKLSEELIDTTIFKINYFHRLIEKIHRHLQMNQKFQENHVLPFKEEIVMWFNQ